MVQLNRGHHGNGGGSRFLIGFVLGSSVRRVGSCRSEEIKIQPRGNALHQHTKRFPRIYFADSIVVAAHGVQYHAPLPKIQHERFYFTRLPVSGFVVSVFLDGAW